MGAKDEAIRALQKLSEEDAKKVLIFLAGMEAGQSTADTAVANQGIKKAHQGESNPSQCHTQGD